MTIEVKAHHRRILDLAAEDNPTNARVDSYKKSIGYQESLAQGWIEELPKLASNGFYFRIIPAGTKSPISSEAQGANQAETLGDGQAETCHFSRSPVHNSKGSMSEWASVADMLEHRREQLLLGRQRSLCGCLDRGLRFRGR